MSDGFVPDSGFEPDGFEPDAAPAKPPAPRYTGLESLGHGLAQGATLGWGDEAQGVIQALLRKYVQDHDPRPFSELYTQERDAARAGDAAAKAAHPAAYGGADAVASIPRSLVGGLPMAVAQGALSGAGSSHGRGDLARNSVLGAGVGAGGYAAGQGLAAAAQGVASLAGRKAGEAVGKAATKVNDAATAELRSEIGSLGGMSSDLHRKIEQMARLLEEDATTGVLSAQSRVELEALRRSPDYAQVVEQAAQRVLATVPGAAGRTAAQGAKVADLARTLPDRVVEETAAKTGLGEAVHQTSSRILRYLPLAAGAYAGQKLGGPLGVVVGASIAGLRSRPVQSLVNWARNPAVQNQLFSGLEGAAEFAGSAALPLARAAAGMSIDPATALAQRLLQRSPQE